VTPALRLLFVGLAFLGAGVLGYFLYDRHRTVAAERATPVAAAAPAPADAVPGDTLPGERTGPGAPTVPDRRPNFALKDLSGRSRSIGEWDGRPLILNFWATWCAPCRREIPLLNRLKQELGPNGTEIIGIAVDFAPDVAQFAKDFHIAYPLLVGEQDALDVASAFGVQAMAFPFTIFTDRAGRVIALHLGELHEPQARAILGAVQQVDAGRWSPDQARAEVRRALASLPPRPGPG
jgi:thiol-disulfide isomerase/thioredoxin